MNIWDALRNSGKVIKEGLITPNEFNRPTADRFKASALPMLGVPGAAAETADELYKGNPGMAALAATGMIPGVGALGSIVRRGNPETLLSHTSDATGLIDALRGRWPYAADKAARRQNIMLPNRDPQLSDPSMAVSNLEEPFGGGVQLYINPSKVDPATTRRASLYPTDAYTYRRTQVQPYLSNKNLLHDARFSENYDAGDPSKYMSIMAQPKFGSLQEYSDSLYGAGKLAKHKMIPGDYVRAGSGKLNAKFNGWLFKNYDLQQQWDKATFTGDAKDKASVMAKFLAENPDAAEMARKIPTEYGELKYHGSLPLTPEYIAAARLVPHSSMPLEMQKEVLQRIRKQGIPLVPEKMTRQRDIAEFVDYRTGLRDKPMPVAPYNDPDWKI